MKILYWISSLVSIYIITTVYIYCLSERWMFPVPKATYQFLPDSFTLMADDKTKLTVAYLKNLNANYTILYSHGNGEDLGEIMPILKKFHEKGFSVLAYDYRGYGTSEGISSEKNTYKDIRLVYHYLTKVLNIPSEKIILYGRSIGSGPTVDLAAEVTVAGVILENPVFSVFRVVTKIPLFPVDRFENGSKIAKVKSPILIMHAKEDKVVPFSQGKLLYQLASGRKYFWEIPKAGHNNIISVLGEKYWKDIQSFSDSLEYSKIKHKRSRSNKSL